MHSCKRTKRVRDEHEGQTLEEHIEARRAVLVRERGEVPSIRAREAEMRAEAARLSARHQLRRRADLLRQADALRREADERESMEREYAFECTVVNYLRRYHQSRPPSRLHRPRAPVELGGRPPAAAARRPPRRIPHRDEPRPPKVAMAVGTSARTAGRPKLLLCAASRSCPARRAATRGVPRRDYTSTAFDQVSSTASTVQAGQPLHDAPLPAAGQGGASARHPPAGHGGPVHAAGSRAGADHPAARARGLRLLRCARRRPLRR